MSIPYPNPHPPKADSHTAIHKIINGNAVHHRLYFQKGLKGTKSKGVATSAAFKSLYTALDTHEADAFEAIQLENNSKADGRKLVNPQAGLAADRSIPAPWHFRLPPPPEQDGKEETAAAEMIELYWMAILRTTPFSKFGSNSTVDQALAELKNLPLYLDLAKGTANNPVYKKDGTLNAKTIFRGGELNPKGGDQIGPYISQFLTLDVPFGTLKTSQTESNAMNTDQQVDSSQAPHMTTKSNWLKIQGGLNPKNKVSDGSGRRIGTMLDLARYVHIDGLYEAYLNAALILLDNGVKFTPGNPYGQSCPPVGGIGTSSGACRHKQQTAQEGFGTFGPTHILSLVCEVATKALKTVWYQKWIANLRLRPEAFSGIVEDLLNGSKKSKTDALAALNNSKSAEALLKASNKAGKAIKLNGSTAYLPMVFEEGSPMHPAYGAGHATVAGACVTVLKAFFDEDEKLVKGKIKAAGSSDQKKAGQKVGEIDGNGDLLPHTDSKKLTIGGELNKLAANISIGRNMAGVHWRSDYTQSILLGQRLAISLLFHQRRDFHERPWNLSLETFGGNLVEVIYDPAKSLDGVYLTKAGKKTRKQILFPSHDAVDMQADEAKALENIV